MSKELQKYRIRATRRPAKNELLSSTALVRNEKGEAGYCYINFDQPLVEKVGKVLPRGVSKEDPAVLSIRFYPRTQVWLIVAQYVSGEHETLLWKTPERPVWLNLYRTRHNGNSNS